MKTCIIVIPLHKFDLNDYEIMSLKQLFSFYYDKYHDIDIAFCYPWDKNIEELETYIQIDWNKVLKNPTHPYWFESWFTYNQLCFRNDFYSPWVDEYKYMLIYHLDAFIFKDELHYWCNKNYDYIGGYDVLYQNNGYKAFNGGFCLRKLSLFTELTKTPMDSLLFDYGITEDTIFSSIIYKDKCNISIEDCIKFGISSYLSTYMLFDLLAPDLPFGCHGIQKAQYLLKKCKENINYTE